MDELDDYAIKKVAKGGFIIFVGIILLFVTTFFYRIIAARHFGPSDYGLLTLGITTLNIATIFGLAGIHRSIGKLVNHYLAKKQYNKLKGVIFSSFIITAAFSVLILLLLYFSSPLIEERLFRIKGISKIIRIFSIGVPFSVLTQMLKYHFFAFKKPEYAIVSESISERMLNLIFLIFVVLLSASVYFLSWAYVASLVISFVVGILILNSRVHKIIRKELKPEFDFKNIISFSMPLMLTGILGVALAWTDTIFIGIFKSDADVGVYNAAYIIASALMIFWLSFGDIFYPIISELYSKKAKDSIRKIFEIASRWIFIMSFPIFLVILVFPSAVISLLFGQNYLSASIPLAILIVGYFFITMFGLAEQGLIVFKKTKFLGIITSVGFFVNIALNIILIPIYGIAGAAIATTFSILMITLLKLAYFKRILQFNYDKPLYFKFVCAGIIAFLITFYSFKLLWFPKMYLFLPALAAYFALYFILLVVFKSFSDEDISVLEAVERKIGVNFTFVKKLIR